jgi:hypothetical protein
MEWKRMDDGREARAGGTRKERRQRMNKRERFPFSSPLSPPSLHPPSPFLCPGSLTRTLLTVVSATVSPWMNVTCCFQSLCCVGSFLDSRNARERKRASKVFRGRWDREEGV